MFVVLKAHSAGVPSAYTTPSVRGMPRVFCRSQYFELPEAGSYKEAIITYTGI